MNASPEFHGELLEIADRLEQTAAAASETVIQEPLRRLEEAASAIGKAWSGSALGYHAQIYYKDLKPPLPGAHFSQEWGLQDSWPIVATTGDWVEYDADDVQRRILRAAGNPELGPARDLAGRGQALFETTNSEVLSILTTAHGQKPDTFVASLKEQVEKLSIPSKGEVTRRLMPSGEIMSRDSLAVSQRIRVPPHISVLADVFALKQPSTMCARLAALARRAGSHLARQQRRSRRAREVGTNVFIGHGRSPLWRELKDFLQDRLGLPWDEFNRVPVAGITNVARLAEMLDAAAIAFLVMTAEDEHADGKIHARMNVVHEAGLFQGRLGFTKAIILLEEGCEEFSNIHGLGQIRFPTGNIRAVFDEVRQVLEREGVIEAG
jgi:predicted nucleotide-binding protein